MRPLTMAYAFILGTLASVCAAQPVQSFGQGNDESVAVRVVDKTSRYCHIEFERPRHHVEAQLVRRGYRPIEAGAQYRMRIEVTGERSEPFTGHVLCKGYLRVILQDYDAHEDTKPLMERTVPVGASNEWPLFSRAVLRAIDTVFRNF